MTAVSWERARRATRSHRARRVAAAIARPARPVLANLAQVPLFIAGLGLIDFGVYHWSHAAGWIAAGGSLILVERVIADQP